MSKQPNEAYSGKEGYHRFHGTGSFEVFWYTAYDNTDVDFEPGWYWHACFPGCLPDSEPNGPFNSSFAAWKDARS